MSSDSPIGVGIGVGVGVGVGVGIGVGGGIGGGGGGGLPKEEKTDDKMKTDDKTTTEEETKDNKKDSKTKEEEKKTDKKEDEEKGFKFTIGHTSLQGVRSSMEDEVLLEEKVILKDKSAYSFLAVFDGHGGRNAAIYTRDHLLKNIVSEIESGKAQQESLTKSFIKTDEDFLATKVDTSGTTACTVLIEHSTKKFWCANAGDSRALLFRANTVVKALSRDHKADRPDEVDRIKKAGGFIIQKRVMGELGISRAIGDADLKTKNHKLVIPDPEFINDSILKDDVFMVIACDGLYDVMNNEEICKYLADELATHNDCQKATDSIVTYAIEKLRTKDNVSCVLIRFD